MFPAANTTDVYARPNLDGVDAQRVGEAGAHERSYGRGRPRRHSLEQLDPQPASWRNGRVLVADPHAVFRAGVRAALARDTDLDVSECEDLESLLTLAARLRPEIALIDLELPPYGGIEAVRRLTAAQPVQAVVWGLEARAADVFNAIRANASGFLVKDICGESLVRVLRGLRAGEAALPRSLALRMIQALQDVERSERARATTERLSRREQTVLALVERNYSNKQIAATLVISEHTVKRHVQNILSKLQQRSREEAAKVFRAARELDEQRFALEQAS